MLCQKCKVNEANTHVKSVVNGHYEEYMLCSECAKSMGYTNMLADFHSDFDSILGSFFSNALPEHSQTVRCQVCGSTYHDIQKSGQVGCANCYDVFLSDLMPSIRRIHGNTTHCGKKPGVVEPVKEVVNSDDEINKLKAELETAIKEQNFELCSVLRDRIKEMEESK